MECTTRGDWGLLRVFLLIHHIGPSRTSNCIDLFIQIGSLINSTCLLIPQIDLLVVDRFSKEKYINRVTKVVISNII